MVALGSIPLSQQVLSQDFLDLDMGDCHLHLLLTSNEFSYCILHEGEVVAMRSYLNSHGDFLQRAQPVAGILDRDEILARSFAKVTVAVEDPRHKLVPKEFFDEKELDTLYYLGKASGERALHFDEVQGLDYCNIVSLDRLLNDLLVSQFERLTFVSSFSRMVSSLLKENARNTEHRLLVNVHHNRLHIFAMKEEVLVRHSTFDFKTGEDFLYYLLHSIEKAKMVPDRTIVILTGNLERKSRHFQLTTDYINKLYFGNRPDHYSYREELGIFPYHFYYQLYAI